MIDREFCLYGNQVKAAYRGVKKHLTYCTYSVRVVLEKRNKKKSPGAVALSEPQVGPPRGYIAENVLLLMILRISYSIDAKSRCGFWRSDPLFQSAFELLL